VGNEGLEAEFSGSLLRGDAGEQLAHQMHVAAEEGAGGGLRAAQRDLADHSGAQACGRRMVFKRVAQDPQFAEGDLQLVV